MAVGISEAPVHLRFCLERKEINQTQSWNPIFWQWDRIKLVVHSHYFLIMLLDPPWEEGVSRGEFQLLLHSCFPALSSDRCTSAQGGWSCSGTWVNYQSFAEPKTNKIIMLAKIVLFVQTFPDFFHGWNWSLGWWRRDDTLTRASPPCVSPPAYMRMTATAQIGSGHLHNSLTNVHQSHLEEQMPACLP